MGTHPIFESDFDCLTELVTMPSRTHLGDTEDMISPNTASLNTISLRHLLLTFKRRISKCLIRTRPRKCLEINSFSKWECKWDNNLSDNRLILSKARLNSIFLQRNCDIYSRLITLTFLTN